MAEVVTEELSPAEELEELHRSQYYALNQLYKIPTSRYWRDQVRWLGTEIRLHSLAKRRDYHRSRYRRTRSEAIYEGTD